jgi:hypothetical protein
MKRLIVLIPLALLLISKGTFAQGSGKCTTPCWEQSFLYQFCPPATTTIVLGCSATPNDDPLGTPIKAYLPGEVAIFDESTIDTLWQPSDSVAVFTGTPPDRQTIFDNYHNSDYGPPPWTEPYDPDSDFWSDDSLAYAVGWAQWDLDSATFLAGDTQEYTYYDNLDFNQQSAFLFYVEHDYQELWEIYDPLDSTYLADSAFYAGGFQVQYAQAWSDSQAATDAQNALNHWLGVCPISPDGSTCTIHIMLDPTVSDWSSGTDPDPKDIFANTPLPKCDEASCADVQRVTTVNTSPAFLYQSNNAKNWFPNPAYKLHAAPKMMWYTGTGLPLMPNIYYYGGYEVHSFYQLMEHEIGHWLGLEHPEWGPSNTADYSCPNCYTNNPLWTVDTNGNATMHSTGFMTVMAQSNNFPNDTALLLTNEDSCEFKKLYCPEDVSVKLGPNPNDWFNPEVFPNPTNGGMTLTFTTIAESLTQVSIYDVLGHQMRMVFDGYSNAGPQSISLGTETLPSGNYVCRVRVGDQVNYINIAITK